MKWSCIFHVLVVRDKLCLKLFTADYVHSEGQAEHPQKHGPRFHVVCLAEEVDLALRVLKTSTDKEWGEFVCQKRRERLAKHDVGVWRSGQIIDVITTMLQHATQCASWSDQQVSRLKEELRMQRKAAWVQNFVINFLNTDSRSEFDRSSSRWDLTKKL